MELTPMQQRIVEEYLVDMNCSRTARSVGMAKDNGKPNGNFHKLMKKPEVIAAIEEAKAERSRRTQIEADRVVRELAKIAFADPRDLMDWGPEGVEVKASGTIPPDAAASVGEVSVQGRNVKVKMLDKLKALELLGRHLGMFTDKVEAEVKQEAKVILFGGE